MCVMHYKTNLCDINPIPAMAHQCASWETCENQDPTIVSRRKVAAEMLAEMLNKFVEPIGLKPLVSLPVDSAADSQTQSSYDDTCSPSSRRYFYS